MSFNNRSDALIELLEELTQESHEYVLVGGYAVSAFNARFSTDLDIVVAPDSKADFFEFLEQRGFEKTDSHAKEWFYDTEVIGVRVATRVTPTSMRHGRSSNGRLATKLGRWHGPGASCGTITLGRSYRTLPRGPVPTRSAQTGVPATGKLPPWGRHSQHPTGGISPLQGWEDVKQMADPVDTFIGTVAAEYFRPAPRAIFVRHYRRTRSLFAPIAEHISDYNTHQYPEYDILRFTKRF
jgi:hypothetical protein